MSVPLEAIPEPSADAVRALLRDINGVLGDDLVAAWLHGGTTFADRPAQPGDLDIAVVVAGVAQSERIPAVWRNDPQSRPGRLHTAAQTIARERSVDFDITYLVLGDTGGGEPPAEAFDSGRGILSWPIYRAHWLAGRYVNLYGRQPEELVVAPTRDELDRALDRELEHLERHVAEGDAADPCEATYAVWNGCRILYTLATGSPVISKRSAGAWALEQLGRSWHPAIEAAGRAYDGHAGDADVELLRMTVPAFVEMVRARLPITEPRPPGPPRWS